MSTNHMFFCQEDEGTPVARRRGRAVVWNYFEKVTGDDGLPRTKCIKCGTGYNLATRSGTSTLRRHLTKCFPQALIEYSPTQTNPGTNIASPNEEPPKDLVVGAAKESSSAMMHNLHTKTDRELQEFIWRTKRNIPLLEERLPDKAILLKETLDSYEAELHRRAKLRLHKESGARGGTSVRAIKIEMHDRHVAENEKFDENMAEDESAVEDETAETHADLSQKSSQFDTGKALVKVETDDQSFAGNENFNENQNVAEEENARNLQIVVATQHVENQAWGPQTDVSISLEEKCDELREVSSMLTMITSAHSLHPPPGYALDEEAQRAKQTLDGLLKKDFESVVGSPDEQREVRSCIRILMNHLDKLPLVQGRVVEGLNVGFEPACHNWFVWRDSVHTHISFEVQEADSLRALQEWQQKDRDLESGIAAVDVDILRLKAQIREKERARERLVKRKFEVFEQGGLSIPESKRLLQDMVSGKLQSDVALDNMKDLAAKWKKMKEDFQSPLD